jgi:hypothetical protein
MEDRRIVYGVHCVWWDGIEKVGKTPERNRISLPCCPHCGSVLFEMDIDDWWRQVNKYDETHPGYRQFTEWRRGKHHVTIQEAKTQYEANGRKSGL